MVNVRSHTRNRSGNVHRVSSHYRNTPPKMKNKSLSSAKRGGLQVYMLGKYPRLPKSEKNLIISDIEGGNITSTSQIDRIMRVNYSQYM